MATTCGRGQVSRGSKSGVRILTTSDAERLLNRVKSELKARKGTRREEEPGLTEEARHFVIRY